MTVKTGHTNAYRILSPGNMSFVLRIILEAEQKSREHLFIVIRKLVRPDFLCSITCRCRHAATFHKFDSRFYRDSKCPSCPIFRYIWLVYPCTGDIYAVWKVRFYTFPQRCCRPGLPIRHPALVQVLHTRCLFSRQRFRLSLEPPSELTTKISGFTRSSVSRKSSMPLPEFIYASVTYRIDFTIYRRSFSEYTVLRF